MNALYEASLGIANDFWTDNKRSHTLALLQDRVSEVDKFVECCCSALALIYNAMFPRNPQPLGLAALMKAFMNGEAIHKFIKVQLVAGAKVALSWVRVHHPRINLDNISQSLPAPLGGGLIPMAPHYAAAREPARRIIRHMLYQDEDFFITFDV